MICTKQGISRRGTVCKGAFRILTGLVVLAGITSSLATTYDLSRDFSPTDNLNGVWTFGAKASLDGQLQPFTVRGITPAGAVPIQYWQLVPYQEPTIYRNGTTNTATVGDQLTLPPGVVWMFGGPSSSPYEFGTIRFTVPSGGAGNYRIETDVRPIYDGNIQGDTDFHVVRNGTELFGRFLAPPDRSGYTNTLLLGAGDTVDFLVGRGLDNNNYGSGLKLKAQLIKNDPPFPPGQVIPIANHSFEDPPVSDGQYTVNEMPGWIGSGPWFHVANPADDWFAGTSAGSSLPNPIDGLNIAGVNTGAWIYQDLTAVVQPGATYTLTMLTGHRIGTPFGRPTVSLIASGQVLAQAIPDAPVESRFSTFQLTYSSPDSGSMIGQPLRIEIRSAGVDAQAWFDDLNLTVVPKPFPPGQVIPIANHSFEDPPVSDGQYTVNEMPGWIGSGPWFHVANPADDWFAGTSAGSSLPNPIDGLNIAGVNTGAWIYQDLTAVVQPGATYTLTMLTGHRIGTPFGRPTVSLMAGGEVLAQAIPDAPVESRFSTFQLTYSSPDSGSMIGQPLRIEIRSAGVDAQPWFDNLNLTVVPTSSPPAGLVANGSFELGTDPGISADVSAPNSTTITGWTVETASVDYIGTRWTAGDGVRCLDLSGIDAGTISQIISGLTPGQSYRLKFLMAGNPEVGLTLARLRANVGSTSGEFSFSPSGHTPTDMGWTEKTLDFVASSVSEKLSFASLIPGWAGAALDKVSIEAVTNTPPPLSLVANGSFELGTDPGISADVSAPNSTTITGWAVENASVDYIGTRWVAGDGVRCLDMSGTDAGTISQMISGLTPGQAYRLSFLMAGNPEVGLPLARLRASVGATAQEFSFNPSGFTPGNMGWTEKMLDFVASTTSEKLSFVSLIPGWAGAALDRVAIVAVTDVPPQPPVSVNYNLGRDFASMNPNGVWSYGYQSAIGAEFNLMASHQVVQGDNGVPILLWHTQTAPAIYANTNDTTVISGGEAHPPHTAWCYAGPESSDRTFAAMRFTVPANGSGIYRIASAVAPRISSGGDDSDYHVAKNGVELFGQFLGATESGGYTNALALQAGDTIDFLVGRGANGRLFGSGLQLQVTIDLIPSSQPTNCPVPAGLVSWWRGEGNAEDSAGSNNGELRNGAAFAPGMVGRGFRFNGLGSYVRIPHAPSLNFSSEFTVELWYKYEGTDVAYGLIAARGTETGPVNFGISVIPTGLGLYFNDPTVANGDDAEHGGAFEASRYLPIPASGVFHHLATTCRQISPTNVEVKTYVNGQLVKTKTIVASLARALSDAAITIGRSAEYGGEFFDGIIDEVSIYNRALAASEIQAIHHAGSAGKCTPTNPPMNHAPVAKALVAPLFSLWTDETTLLVIAGNGVNAEVNLDGSMSSDADGDALAYLWMAEEQATPFAVGVLATNTFELGEHNIVLLVDDGQAAGHDAVTIEVITLSEAVEELLLFVSETDLSRNEKRPLLATLNRVWDSFEEGDLRSGVRQLGALQQKTRAHLLKAKPDAGRKLIDAADQIIDAATAAMDDDSKSRHHGRGRK